MNILIMNKNLQNVGGTETWCFTIIKELIKRNHNVDVFALNKGDFFNYIVKTFPNVGTELKKEYDLILVNHNSSLQYLIDNNIKGYKIYTCHGIQSDDEKPIKGADFYVSISEEVFDYLQSLGFNSTIIRNPIDIDYFSCKNNPNPVVKNVLCISDWQNSINNIKELCLQLNLNFKSLGKQNFEYDIREYLEWSDIVICVGRSCYEAMSYSRPVIIYDHRDLYSNNKGLGDGYITIDNFNEFKKKNCSGRTNKYEYNVSDLKLILLNKYNPVDGQTNRILIEKEFDVKKIVDSYLNIYNIKDYTVVIHGCFLGKTGYAYHTRNFAIHLNKYLLVRVRNFSYDDDPYYLDDEQRNMIIKDHEGEFWNDKNKKIINIVLCETNHYYFYDEYNRDNPLIFYNVWESTRQPKDFFKVFTSKPDQIWVPSEWQKKYTFSQMINDDLYADTSKIKIVPEGIDVNRFYFSEEKFNLRNESKKFTFLIIGRWEYRKATLEMIKAFYNVFKNYDNIQLLILGDNPFDWQKKHTVKEKLKEYNLECENIIPISKLNDKQYVDLIQSSHVFLSCSRSEGWNLPLIEAIACGIPSICSNWSGQLEFAQNTASKLVPIKKFLPAKFDDPSRHCPGEYAEPDFEQLENIIFDVFNSYHKYEEKAKKSAKYIRENFNWKRSTDIAFNNLIDIINKKENININKDDINIIDKKDNFNMKEIIVIDSYTNSKEKEDKLINLIKTIKSFNIPILLVSHYPLNSDIQQMVNYYIFDIDNSKGSHYLDCTYNLKNVQIKCKLDEEYHVLPIIKSINNSVRFCLNKYDIIHWFEYDVNANFNEYLNSARNNLEKYKLYGLMYENMGIDTTMFSFHTDFMKDVNLPETWDEYYKNCGSNQEDIIFENWLYKYLSKIDINNFHIDSNTNCLFKKDSFKQLDNDIKILACPKNNFEDFIFIINKSNKIINNFEVFLKGEKKISSVIKPSLYKYFVLEKKDDLNKKDINILINGKYKSINYDKENKCKFDNGIKSSNWIEDNNNVMIDNNESFRIFFVNKPFCEILGKEEKEYLVKFIDKDSDEVVYETKIKNNNWCRCLREYYTNWRVEIYYNNKLIKYHDFDLKDKKVLINIDSKSLGDTIAWVPVVNEFKKKHKCEVVLCTFHNYLFKDVYKDISFIEPGNTILNLYAGYTIGCFDNNIYKNKEDWRTVSLQQIACDILGIEYKEDIYPEISFIPGERPIEKKYICISEHSTMQCKYWNRKDAWQKIVDYLKKLNYEVVVISKEKSNLENVIHRTNKPLSDTINTIYHSEFFIGLGSGLSWISWALMKPVIMIAGFSEPWFEFNTGIIRILPPEGICSGCFNDPNVEFDRGWNWCPYKKNYECSRLISEKIVYKAINKAIDFTNSGLNIDTLSEFYS